MVKVTPAEPEDELIKEKAHMESDPNIKFDASFLGRIHKEADNKPENKFETSSRASDVNIRFKLRSVKKGG